MHIVTSFDFKCGQILGEEIVSALPGKCALFKLSYKYFLWDCNSEFSIKSSKKCFPTSGIAISNN